MDLLQKTLGYFRRPETTPTQKLQAAAVDERIGGTRSKRARIREVLRRYEQSALKEGQAVEELLSIMR